MPKLSVLAFLQANFLKKMLKLLVLAFLQVKLKKNTRTNSSGVFIVNFLKKMPKLSVLVFLQINFFKKMLLGRELEKSSVSLKIF
jgi:hypothetical protein